MRSLVVLAVVLAACSDAGLVGPGYFAVRGIDLDVPQRDGWKRDRAAEVENADAGGVALRLVRKNAAVGSPRIDVVLDPKLGALTNIEDFLQRNLTQMRTLEKSGQLHLSDVEQQAVTIGPRRGYRVRHEYILATAQVAVTQIAVLLVLDGRGVAVSASGRTELLLPLADDVDAILRGLRTPLPAQGAAVTPVEPVAVPVPVNLPSLVQPVDLGKIGGKK